MNRAPCVLAFFLLSGAAAWSHDEKLSVSRIEVGDAGITWTVDVSLAGLEKVLKLPADPIDLTERQFQGMKESVVGYLRTCMRVEVDGADVEAEAGPLEPLYETFVPTGEKYIAHARQEFRFRSAGSVKRVTLSGAFFSTKTDQHHAVLNVSWNGARKSFSRFGPFDLELTPSTVNPTFWSTAVEFTLWGLRRMLIAAASVAFILGLALGARTLGELGRCVASFAVAQSVTLVLSALNVLRLPVGLTATLVAASVVYVAAENYFLKETRYRWVLAFTFGLIHGVGFAGVLGDRLIDVESKILPVLSFDAGLLLGEAAIVLVAAPLLGGIRKGADEAASARRHAGLVKIGSLPVLLFGAVLVVDRVLGRGWLP